MYEKVERLMQEKGVKASDVAKAVGISSSVFTDWKKGRYTPKADKLYSIAKYFGVPMEFFFEDGAVPIKDQADLDAYFDQINDMRERHGKPPIKEKPVYRASAGQGAYNDTYADKSIEAEGGYEYAEVVGDSMLPILQNGDVVKIQPQTETTPHDYTLVKVDGEHATIKFVEIVENGVWLRALNKEVFEDKFFSIQEVLTLPVTIIGKAVEVRRPL